ncbi:MAG: hypothetical protein AAB354_15595 [candidate division KSB1 bacterium]
MTTREIIAFEDFEQLTALIASLAEDYKEDLDCLSGAKAHDHSLPFLYGSLLLSKAYFERSVAGLRHTTLGFSLYEKLNGQWLQFDVQKEQLRHQLLNFLQACRQDEALRHQIKTAADEADANITVEKNSGLLLLHRREEVDSLNIHAALTAIDHLRLLVDERKNLGLQYLLDLKRDQGELETVFAELERLFWENLPILRRFRATLREHREAFLILDDKKYPWWYPEKRGKRTASRAKAASPKPSPFDSDAISP